MTVRKFRFVYCLAVVLSLTVVYGIVGAKDDMPLRLSDAQMQDLIGQRQWFRCSPPLKGCPAQAGICFQHVTGSRIFTENDKRYACFWTNQENDWCFRDDFNVTCEVDWYSDGNCQVWNYTKNFYGYTTCAGLPN